MVPGLSANICPLAFFTLNFGVYRYLAWQWTWSSEGAGGGQDLVRHSLNSRPQPQLFRIPEHLIPITLGDIRGEGLLDFD